MMLKFNKYISVMAIGIILPAMVVSLPVSVDATEIVFKDVPKTNQYYLPITEMTKQGIISGYEDGTFRPNEAITRKHAAALVSRAKGNKLPQTVKFVKFNDVSEKNAAFEDIKKLQQAGIFTPDAKGNFNPNQVVTRAEMAKILTIAFRLEVKANYDFPDVPASHPENKYVRALYSNGITKGDNGKFLPNNSVTRGHYAAFMYRVMNLDTGVVVKPIDPVKPTPKPEPKPDPKPGTGNDNNSGTIVDNYDRPSDVPKPPGYKAGFEEEQRKKQAEIRVKESHNMNGGFTLFGDSGKLYLESFAKNVGLSTKEFTDVVNNSIKTGQVHDGGNFSLYYDYSTGQVSISRKRSKRSLGETMR